MNQANWVLSEFPLGVFLGLWVLLRVLLGSAWGPLGVFLGLWVFLGSSWGPLGVLLGRVHICVKFDTERDHTCVKVKVKSRVKVGNTLPLISIRGVTERVLNARDLCPNMAASADNKKSKLALKYPKLCQVIPLHVLINM